MQSFNIPVSYTHLDVYKRQALEPSITAAASSGYPSEFPYILQKERMHCACNILNHFAGRLEMWEVYSLFAPKPLMIHQGSYDPVSYTHLDVYKRQITRLEEAAYYV